MSAIFTNGQCLVVTTRGAGNLHLLSYQSSAGASARVGFTPTINIGVTRFLISFSHTFERYAFFWQGTGEAVYGIGTSLQRRPVGRSWAQASAVEWGDTAVTAIDVSSIAHNAINKGSTTTCFIIPDQI